jgi:hypothetical protein
MACERLSSDDERQKRIQLQSLVGVMLMLLYVVHVYSIVHECFSHQRRSVRNELCMLNMCMCFKVILYSIGFVIVLMMCVHV